MIPSPDGCEGPCAGARWGLAFLKQFFGPGGHPRTTPLAIHQSRCVNRLGYDQAVAVVAQSRNASISYVQRRLTVGYNRAARMVEKMENDGMVGPQVGTRSREVFLRNPDEESGAG